MPRLRAVSLRHYSVFKTHMKTTTILILITVFLIGGAVMLVSNSKDSASDTIQALNNVSMVDGKQVIAITAKGGYSPKITTAQAGIPTVIVMTTKGTFDCASALTIPSVGYRGNLPPSGETRIDIPPQEAGAKLQGLCAMGMYNFAINFN